MAKKVQVNNFAEEIVKMLTEYTDEVTDIARGVVENVAQGCADEIKNHITWKDKKYSKSFDLKTTFEAENFESIHSKSDSGISREAAVDRKHDACDR